MKVMRKNSTQMAALQPKIKAVQERHADDGDHGNDVIVRRTVGEVNVPLTEADFIDNVDFIARFIKREVYVSAYDVDEGEKVYYQLDPDVEKALDALPKAKQLLENPSRMIAEQLKAERDAR